MNKKNLTACICSAVIAIGAVVWLADRRNMIDLTALMGSMHTPTAAEQPQAEPEPPASPAATEQTAPSEKPNLPPPDPQMQPTGGKDGTAGNTPQDLGTITVQETEEIAKPGDDCVVRRSKITLPEEALAWTRPAQYPKEGDLLQITVPENHLFIIEVLSFEQLPQERGLVVLGALYNGKGSANLMLHESYFSLSVTDEEHHRIYNIYYDVTQNYYTVEELDTTLAPTPAPCRQNDRESLQLLH